MDEEELVWNLRHEFQVRFVQCTASYASRWTIRSKYNNYIRSYIVLPGSILILEPLGLGTTKCVEGFVHSGGPT